MKKLLVVIMLLVSVNAYAGSVTGTIKKSELTSKPVTMVLTLSNGAKVWTRDTINYNHTKYRDYDNIIYTVTYDTNNMILDISNETSAMMLKDIAKITEHAHDPIDWEMVYNKTQQSIDSHKRAGH